MTDVSGGHQGASRLKTLFVCPYSPYPLNFGGAIRVYNLMRTVKEFSDITLICRTDEDQHSPLTDLGGWCDEVVLVEPEHGDRAALQRRSIVSRHSFLYLDHRCERFQHELTELLGRREFDVIVIEHTQMSSYDLGDAMAVTVLDLHNIEHELVRRRAAVSGRGLRRAALELEWRKLRREEMEACGRYDLVFTTSEREKALLEGWVPDATVVTVPNSIDPSRFDRHQESVDGREVLFVGLTHVDANRDGVRWFVDDIFPRIEQLVPDVRLTIVGRRSTSGDPRLRGQAEHRGHRLGARRCPVPRPRNHLDRPATEWGRNATEGARERRCRPADRVDHDRGRGSRSGAWR